MFGFPTERAPNDRRITVRSLRPVAGIVLVIRHKRPHDHRTLPDEPDDVLIFDANLMVLEVTKAFNRPMLIKY